MSFIYGGIITIIGIIILAATFTMPYIQISVQNSCVQMHRIRVCIHIMRSRCKMVSDMPSYVVAFEGLTAKLFG